MWWKKYFDKKFDIKKREKKIKKRKEKKKRNWIYAQLKVRIECNAENRRTSFKRVLPKEIIKGSLSVCFVLISCKHGFWKRAIPLDIIVKHGFWKKSNFWEQSIDAYITVSIYIKTEKRRDSSKHHTRRLSLKI